MLVVKVSRTGGPEVLEPTACDAPEPASTEVRVRILAAGVNPVDVKTRRGEGVARWLGPPPFVLGWDLAGVVDAVGYGVTRFRPGERVFGLVRFPRQGACYAEYATAPSRQLAPVPAGLAVEEAAALPLAGLTAAQALLDTARLAAGQRVLVYGASGGVGHLAIQIARAAGAETFASARRGAWSWLSELGAHDLLEPGDRERLERIGADVALDLVGGAATGALVTAVREGGMLLAVAEGADDAVKRAASARRVRVEEPLVEPDGHALEALSALVGAGSLRVRVAETFPLEEAAAAHRRLEKGGVGGKLVLTPT